MYWFFRLYLISILFIGFLDSNKLPNGNFSAKEIGVYYLSSMSAIAVSFLLIKKRNMQWFHFIDIIVVCFLLLGPLTQYISFKGIALSVVIQHLALLLCYFSIRIFSIMLRPIQVVAIVNESIFITIFFTVLLALSQKMIFKGSINTNDITGMFVNSGPFAIHLMCLNFFLFIFVIYSLVYRRSMKLLPNSILLLFSMYIIFTSYSRSAWLGLIGAIIFIVILYIFIYLNKKNSFFCYKNIFIFLFVSLISILPLAITLYNLKPLSADGRLLIWHSSLLMLKDHWTTGIGVGMFSSSYFNYQSLILENEYINNLSYRQLAGDVRYAFNDILQISIERGILGGITYLTMVISAIVFAHKKIKVFSSINYIVVCLFGLIGIVVSIFFSGLTSYPLHDLTIYMLMLVIIALIISLSSKGFIITSRFSYFLIFAMLSGGIFTLVYSTLRLKAYIEWANYRKEEKDLLPASFEKNTSILSDNHMYLFFCAKKAIQEENIEKATIYLEQAISYTFFPKYYYLLGQCYEELGNFELAMICYQKVHRAVPNLLTPLYLTAKMYYRQQDQVNFKTLARKGIDFIPKYENEEVAVMKTELKYLLRNMDNL